MLVLVIELIFVCAVWKSRWTENCCLFWIGTFDRDLAAMNNGSSGDLIGMMPSFVYISIFPMLLRISLSLLEATIVKPISVSGVGNAVLIGFVLNRVNLSWEDSLSL